MTDWGFTWRWHIKPWFDALMKTATAFFTALGIFAFFVILTGDFHRREREAVKLGYASYVDGQFAWKEQPNDVP